MNKKTWYLDEVVSSLENLGIVCKDTEGNWRNTEDILQDIAEHWGNTKDLIEEYFNIKEEIIMPQIVSPPENKIPEKRPIITTCPHCKYKISYTEDEVERVDNESMGVICPHCGSVVETEHIEPFTFPDTFYHFGTSKGSACLSDDEVQYYVDIVKRKLQQEC